MFIAGCAKLWEGADAEAAVWSQQSVEANRNHPLAHFQLAVALASLSKLDEAQAAAKAGLSLQPSFTIRRYRANALSSQPAYLAGRERIYHFMRKAGVPEGDQAPPSTCAYLITFNSRDKRLRYLDPKRSCDFRLTARMSLAGC